MNCALSITHGYALLASYFWEDDANLLKSFSNDSLIELVLKDLSIIQVNIVLSNLISMDQELLSNGLKMSS